MARAGSKEFLGLPVESLRRRERVGQILSHRREETAVGWHRQWIGALGRENKGKIGKNSHETKEKERNKDWKERLSLFFITERPTGGQNHYT